MTEQPPEDFVNFMVPTAFRYRALHECSQLWVTPAFIEHIDGWSWRLDVPNPLEGHTPWRLDCFIGHYFVYEKGPVKAVWRIIGFDQSQAMVLGKWPD